MPDTQTRVFRAPYDSGTKMVSAVVCTGFLILTIALGRIEVGCVAALIVLFAYAYSPRRYTVTNDAIVVERLVGDVRVPLEDVREARTGTCEDFRGCMRLWGNGGLFGYYGRFRTTKLGNCRWFLTNRRHTVVFITGTHCAVFSPDDADGFLKAIREVTPVRGVAEVAVPDTRAGSQFIGRRASAVLGIVVGVAAIALVVLAASYAPGLPAYTLSGRTLTIQDHFYPVTINAGSIDLAHLRVVDISRDPEWRPTGRTNGFSNSHYHSGWFRVAGGQKARMYWSAGPRLVLLPARETGASVLLEVRDPEAFLETLRREWSR